MKKSVRFLAVFMAAVVLLCSMAINSFAASTVESVDINIDVAPGVNMSDYDDYITINTSGVSVENSNGVCVYDVYNGKMVSGEFKKCGRYTLSFYLLVDSGYSWSEDMFEGVTVNGDFVYYDFSDDYDVILVEYYVELDDSVTDVDLTIDVYGEMAEWMYDRYIIFNSYGLYYNDVKFDAVNAYDAEGNEVDTFVAGEDYTIEMFFEPAYGCYFEKDESGNFVMNSVIVNGEAAEYYIDSYNVNGYFEYIKITAQVTAKSANFIKDISFDIDTDLDGVNVADWEDYITIKSEGIRFENYLDDPAVYAFDILDERVETFEKGEIYYLYIYFTPEEGYFFPYDEIINSVTVNGTSDYDTYYLDYYYADDGTRIDYICIEMTVDLVGDSFFDQIAYFFRTLFNMIRMFISELLPW